MFTLQSVSIHYFRKTDTSSDMLLISTQNAELLLGLEQQLVSGSQRTAADHSGALILQNWKYHIIFKQLPEHWLSNLISWIWKKYIYFFLKTFRHQIANCLLTCYIRFGKDLYPWDADRHLVRLKEPQKQVRPQVFIGICGNSSCLWILLSVY